VLLNSSLLEKPRGWLKKLHPKINELLTCRMCLGFWVALGLTQSLIPALAIAAGGFIVGDRFLNCSACRAPKEIGNFKING
jgi:hypothetical protein